MCALRFACDRRRWVQPRVGWATSRLSMRRSGDTGFARESFFDVCPVERGVAAATFWMLSGRYLANCRRNTVCGGIMAWFVEEFVSEGTGLQATRARISKANAAMSSCEGSQEGRCHERRAGFAPAYSPARASRKARVSLSEVLLFMAIEVKQRSCQSNLCLIKPRVVGVCVPRAVRFYAQ